MDSIPLSLSDYPDRIEAKAFQRDKRIGANLLFVISLDKLGQVWISFDKVSISVDELGHVWVSLKAFA